MFQRRMIYKRAIFNTQSCKWTTESWDQYISQQKKENDSTAMGGLDGFWMAFGFWGIAFLTNDSEASAGGQGSEAGGRHSPSRQRRRESCWSSRFGHRFWDLLGSSTWLVTKDRIHMDESYPVTTLGQAKLTHRIHVCYIWYNMYHQYTPNATIHNIHGSYG
jgi:hypothetical protein